MKVGDVLTVGKKCHLGAKVYDPIFKRHIFKIRIDYINTIERTANYSIVCCCSTAGGKIQLQHLYDAGYRVEVVNKFANWKKPRMKGHTSL